MGYIAVDERIKKAAQEQADLSKADNQWTKDANAASEAADGAKTHQEKHPLHMKAMAAHREASLHTRSHEMRSFHLARAAHHSKASDRSRQKLVEEEQLKQEAMLTGSKAK